MAYFPPFIDSAGLHIPIYSDILADLIAQTQQIFGADIYLGIDSQDYQFLSILALKQNDTLQAIQLAYNNRSPVSAIGSALDGLVKINGLTRKVPSFSTCVVILSGVPGTSISNGIVTDINNNRWDLPAQISIGANGSVSATAQCETLGAITALSGNINGIATPTKGWISVTNTVSAVPGIAVETDSQLRARQDISTYLPSQTLLAGTTAGIASVLGVTRYQVYENDTGTADANGLPPHSITAVVEGGIDGDIASQIHSRKGIGCYTNGTTMVLVADSYGKNTTIRFYRPSYVPIFVNINVTKMARYTDNMTAAIQLAISTYLNSLQIGETLVFSVLNAVAMSVQPNLSAPVFAITAVTTAKTINPTGTVDIPIAFNEVTQGILDNIVVTAT